MSKPFTYEVDERRLSLQLRSMTLHPNEETWLKFEAYAAAHPLHQAKRRFTFLEFNLNRNVVLPVVFGLIVCVFTFFLFNFISIKKPLVNNDQKPEVPAGVSTPKKQIKTMESPKVVAPPEIVPEQTPPDNKSSKNENNKEAEVLTPPTAVAPANINPMSSEPGIQTSLISAPAGEIKHQNQLRRKRRNDSEQQLSKIRPTVVTDEEVVDVIPN